MELTGLGEIFGKLFLACILGGLIGYESEARHKSAGLRTNILVCLGSCLVMMISDFARFRTAALLMSVSLFSSVITQRY